ncbi:cysteine-rich DPF motif domain-containing protein 1 [Onthophagus taurus]|uniref:cysteine-rich DPF motif domain-containing protein 1 n=1 Tax=Onthophagus taurus TaxID=166361 RepID=UPI0039BE3D1C
MENKVKLEDIKEEDDPKLSNTDLEKVEKPKERLYFQCSLCSMREECDYFGMNPPFTNKYLLKEDVYILEDPFVPPKTGQFIILGSVCVKCKKGVCKDGECSLYFDGTFCMKCAKDSLSSFPKPIQDKINKIVMK